MTEITKQKIEAQFGEKILAIATAYDELAFMIERADLIEVIMFLHDDFDLQYLHLSDITAVDQSERERRFDLVYHLYSFKLREYVRVKVQVGDGESVATLTSEWDSANWLEREVFDMFGIDFDGHPDLRRILMPPDFEGHPLRRDYPLTYEMPQFTHNRKEPPEVIR